MASRNDALADLRRGGGFGVVLVDNNKTVAPHMVLVGEDLNHSVIQYRRIDVHICVFS